MIGAVAVGALAAFLSFSYVRGVENRSAQENQLVKVLVATGPIAEGASADDAIATRLIAPDDRRRADLPAAVVTSAADVAGQVATVDLAGGEIITTTMFASATDATDSNGSGLDKGNVAITISVDEAAGVAGLVRPGDSINILVQASPAGTVPSGAAGPIGTAGGYELPTASVYAFQDVKVLAVGQSLGAPAATGTGGEATSPEQTPGAGSGLITVQLPPDRAALLAGVRSANLYLTLNRPDYEPVPVPFRAAVPLPGEMGVSPYTDDAADDLDGKRQ